MNIIELKRKRIYHKEKLKNKLPKCKISVSQQNTIKFKDKNNINIYTQVFLNMWQNSISVKAKPKKNALNKTFKDSNKNWSRKKRNTKDQWAYEKSSSSLISNEYDVK